MKNITFPNGVYFVHKKSGVIDSLFNTKQTASGHYKKFKNRIIFHDMEGSPFVALIMNTNESPFFVNCSRLANGRTFYQFGLSTINEQILGITGHSQGRALAETIKEEVKE